MPTITLMVNNETMGCASYRLDGNAAGARSYKRYGFHGDIPAGFIFARGEGKRVCIVSQAREELSEPGVRGIERECLASNPRARRQKSKNIRVQSRSGDFANRPRRFAKRCIYNHARQCGKETDSRVSRKAAFKPIGYAIMA